MLFSITSNNVITEAMFGCLSCLLVKVERKCTAKDKRDQ